MKVLFKSFYTLLWNMEEWRKYKTVEEQQKQEEKEKVNLKAKSGCYWYSLSTFWTVLKVSFDSPLGKQFVKSTLKGDLFEKF